MKLVPLVSGGLDSALMTLMAVEQGAHVYPLFINYGQLSCERELAACQLVFDQHQLPAPKIIDVSGYGSLARCGLTNSSFDVFLDAFLPGRNLLFLLSASAYAYDIGASAIAVGLLDENASIFPDQTKEFAQRAEELIQFSTGSSIQVLTPLIELSKADVIALAKTRNLTDTYSCHTGTAKPCGRCVACREFESVEV